MQRLATASQENDKAGIIDISKQIAVCAQNVVTISKTIPGNAEDKGQILSFALAAKGTSVQLKILSAVVSKRKKWMVQKKKLILFVVLESIYSRTRPHC